MMLSKLNIPFEVVTDGANLFLLSVSPNFEYVDGKKTDKIVGQKYTVVEDKTFEKFTVKIPSTTALISNEQIQSSKERIKVSFESAIAKPYRSYSGEYDLSVSAKNITILK